MCIKEHVRFGEKAVYLERNFSRAFCDTFSRRFVVRHMRVHNIVENSQRNCRLLREQFIRNKWIKPYQMFGAIHAELHTIYWLWERKNEKFFLFQWPKCWFSPVIFLFVVCCEKMAHSLVWTMFFVCPTFHWEVYDCLPYVAYGAFPSVCVCLDIDGAREIWVAKGLSTNRITDVIEDIYFPFFFSARFRTPPPYWGCFDGFWEDEETYEPGFEVIC